MKLANFMANMLITQRENAYREHLPNIKQLDQRFDAVTQFELGTFPTSENAPRTRKQIYTQWQVMQADPQIAEALSLHVTAALGGHETTGEVIFITPHERIRGKGVRAKKLREQVEREARRMTPLINRMAFSLARQAIGYGDSYARIYSHKQQGVVDLINDQYTQPPLIQAFEQGGRTVGFFALEMDDWTNVLAKLTPLQMLRVKMPRVEYVPQAPLGQWLKARLLEYDVQADMPVLPAAVGGSFLYPVEGAWRDAMLNLLALNNQQIADSVKQAFLTVDMEGMPPDQQKRYKAGLVQMLQNYRDRIKAAFEGGEEIFGTNYHVLPTWGSKQTITPLGDLSQRVAPLNDSTLMLNLRRVAGGLGMDLSLMGWADMLAGGLGDGASFHTSAQIMRRSMLIRQALIDSFNDLMALHFALRYQAYFYDGEYPWQFDFYSDQSAAATEALTNKQTRINTAMLKVQMLQMLHELGLPKEATQLILENDAGEDFESAKKLAESLLAAPPDGTDGGMMGQGAMGMGGLDDEASRAESDDLDDEADDDLGDDLDDEADDDEG